MSLYKRITETGTLSEQPCSQSNLRPAIDDKLDARLSMLVEDHGINATAAKAFYAAVSRRKTSDHEENTIFEQLLFALHQCSALHALRSVPRKADIARVGIVTWYYGVYAAASAMVAAQDGSFQDEHTGTAGAGTGRLPRTA